MVFSKGAVSTTNCFMLWVGAQLVLIHFKKIELTIIDGLIRYLRINYQKCRYRACEEI